MSFDIAMQEHIRNKGIKSYQKYRAKKVCESVLNSMLGEDIEQC